MNAPGDHAVAAALDRWRELDRLAELSWPEGFDPSAVAAEAGQLAATLAAAVDAAPEKDQGWFSRELVRASQHAPEFRPTVAPRRQGSAVRPLSPFGESSPWSPR